MTRLQETDAREERSLLFRMLGGRKIIEKECHYYLSSALERLVKKGKAISVGEGFNKYYLTGVGSSLDGY